MRKRKPIVSWLYSYSLGIALALLFTVSFALHWWGSLIAANEEAVRHGGAVQSLAAYLLDARLWFEVLPELAIRVHVHRSPCLAFDLSPPQGLAGIKARRCSERRDRRIIQVVAPSVANTNSTVTPQLLCSCVESGSAGAGRKTAKSRLVDGAKPASAELEG